MAHEELNDWRKIFKYLALSKIVYLSLVTMVPHAIINQFNNIQKALYGMEKTQK